MNFSSVTSRDTPLAYTPLTQIQPLLGFKIARILQAVLPKEVFCWISRSTIMLQSIIFPQRWPYWTRLTEKLYVGGMPLKNWGHVNAINDLGIAAILSINEDFEFNKQLWADPIQPNEWEEHNISFLNLSIPDLQPLSPVILAQAVEFVFRQHLAGKKILIHCTGGRGRSVSAAIASLVRINGIRLEEAFHNTTHARSQAMLSQQQIHSIIEWSNS
ncbi:MAG: dual specificity protein phosphatase family protein [Candidatus Protochlamydia sp.]|nr:dual specificity protein phosphatase family protein [Candidatus Protochlamydia sp.]